jgi:hypothetical protein
VIKAIGVVGAAAVIGMGLGWLTYQSRYSGPSEFGPFSSQAPVSAAEVSLKKGGDEPRTYPKLEVVNGEQYEFGVMEPGGEGTHTFVVRNVGEAPLELTVVGSTCKCTVGTLKDSQVAPGEQTEIEMKWVAKSDIEEFGQSATLRTNDPARGELSLRISGRVISTMTMSPRTFAIGDVESGESIRLDSIIYSFSKTPIKPISQVFSDLDMTGRSKFTVEEVSPASLDDPQFATATQAFKLGIEIAPGLRQGPIRENFTFEFVPASAINEGGSFDPDMISRFTAEVTGKVVGAITLVESQRVYNGSEGYIFTMGEFDPKSDKPQRANLLLRGPQRDAIKLTVGDVEPAGVLKAELGEPVGRNTTVLVPLLLWIDPEAKPTELMGRGNDDFGTVWIRAEGPEGLEISPLRLRVRFATPKK